MRKIPAVPLAPALLTVMCSAAQAQSSGVAVPTDESLLQRQEVIISIYEPPAPLPLPDSLINLRGEKLAVSSKFSCPADSGAMTTVPLVPGKKVTVTGPEGDEVSFAPKAHAPDQIARATMRHGPVIFCLTSSQANSQILAWRLDTEGRLTPIQGQHK